MKSRLLLLALIIGIQCAPIICYGGETKAEAPAVYGKDIEDGSYEVRVESNSSMFRVVKAQLNVQDGNMTVDMTLSGTGYLKLFMGTGEEALKAGEESYISYREDQEGAYTYTIPVEALNVGFPCAAYSKRKETWYDRELVIWSSSLPEEKLKPAPAPMERDSGNYTIEVSLKGGTGRAFIVSPAHIYVSEGTAIASIEWSSPDFDYMIVNGEKYVPVNSEGNSVFEIPILALDQEMDVIADTIAMSSPHEIEYTLIFHSDTMKKNRIHQGIFAVGLLLAAGIISGGIFRYKCKNKGKVQDA